MRILILEDDIDRMEVFYSKLANDHTVVWVDTASQAIGYLGRGDFDVVFLDHDLGGEVFVNQADANTGSEVVRWMVSTDTLLSRPTVVIHSLNFPAARSMEDSLNRSDRFDNVYRIPFNQLASRYLDDPGFLSQ